jgi:FSR family fosmidomycin resistance protein-like MFS transporter
MRPNNENKPGLFLVTFSHGLIHVFAASLAPLFPLIRTEFGLSYTAVGIVSFVLSMCLASSGIPVGIVSDKTDRITLVLSAFFLIGIFSSAMILVPTFLGLLVFLILLFLSIGFFHPPVYSYLSARYLRKKGNIVGIFETGGSVGVLVAPLVAGVVGSYLGWRYVYPLWAAPAFVTAYFFFRFSSRKKPRGVSKDEDNRKKTTEQSFSKRNLLGYPHLKVIFLVQGCFGFITGGSASFLPLYLTDVHGLTVSAAGGMLALFLSGGLIGKIIGGRGSDLWDPRSIIALGFFITFFFLILIPLVTGLLLIFVLFPAGIAFFMTMPGLFLLTGEIKTPGRGMAYGIQFLSMAGFGACSKILSGVIADLLGMEYIFFLLAAVALLTAALAHFCLR